MKLYYSPLSTYSQKVRIAIAEKGLDIDTEKVNLMSPEAHAAYREIYPIGKVPFLLGEDDHHVPESSIIIEYLDDKFPDTPRLSASGSGDGPRQLRCIDRMTDFYLINTVGGLLLRRIGVRTPDPMQDEKDRHWLNISYGWLDRQLGAQPFAAGDRFSIVDCGVAAALFYAPEVASFAGFANLKVYAGRLAERDSVRNAHAEMAQVWNAIKQRAAG
ncbi:MAG: glutathione S-transferase family protein [Lysobacteraceae bacterium]